MITLHDILPVLRPGAEWVLSGPALNDLVWLDKIQTSPTQEEVDIAIANWTQIDYAALRSSAYPSLADLADALVHQANGDSSHLLTYFAACNAVKSRFPKPI